MVEARAIPGLSDDSGSGRPEHLLRPSVAAKQRALATLLGVRMVVTLLLKVRARVRAVLAIALPETFAQFIEGFVMIFKFDLVNVFALGCLSSAARPQTRRSSSRWKRPKVSWRNSTPIARCLLKPANSRGLAYLCRGPVLHPGV